MELEMLEAVMLAIWDRFKKAKIDIPYPQRDVHISGLSSDMLKSFAKEQDSTDNYPS